MYKPSSTNFVPKQTLPPTKLSQNDMRLIVNDQKQRGELLTLNRERNENIYNRQVQRANVKVGNWFEEQQYWDAMEARDCEYDNANSIISNPLVISKELYVTANTDYGKFGKENIVADKTHMRTKCEFENKEKFLDQTVSHKFFAEETTEKMPTRCLVKPSMNEIKNQYDVKIHEVKLK
ncbi:Conserved_hypothetical protein [Hexamita inflata]|uniref:Uncharacterized protein n=1 Tax=Hexamita inflata TaxID=28002 RepID=A0AA86QB38_9EUKA|nr:Conserved hypothetical protein [Hexamita inflata]